MAIMSFSRMPTFSISYPQEGSDSEAESSSDDDLQTASDFDEVKPNLVVDPKTPVEPNTKVKRASIRTKNQPAGPRSRITKLEKGNGKPEASQEAETRSSANSDLEEVEPNLVIDAETPVEPHADVEGASRKRRNQPAGPKSKATKSEKGNGKPEASQETETKSSANSEVDEREPNLAVNSKTPVEPNARVQRVSTRTKNQIAESKPNTANSKKQRATTRRSNGNGKPDASQETETRSSTALEMSNVAARTRRRKNERFENQNAATEGSNAKGDAKPGNTIPQPKNTEKQIATTEESKGAAKMTKKPRSTKYKSTAENAARGPDLAHFTKKELLELLAPSETQASLWGDDPIHNELAQIAGAFFIRLSIVSGELSKRGAEQ